MVGRRREHEARPALGLVELGPATAYEAVTRQMVEDLARELGEIKGRLNGLLFMVAGAFVIDLVLRLTGA